MYASATPTPRFCPPGWAQGRTLARWPAVARARKHAAPAHARSAVTGPRVTGQAPRIPRRSVSSSAPRWRDTTDACRAPRVLASRVLCAWRWLVGVWIGFRALFGTGVRPSLVGPSGYYPSILRESDAYLGNIIDRRDMRRDTSASTPEGPSKSATRKGLRVQVSSPVLRGIGGEVGPSGGGAEVKRVPLYVSGTWLAAARTSPRPLSLRAAKPRYARLIIAR